MRWRVIFGGAAGLASALLWSASLAIYQPFMQPQGFFTDPTTGDTYPHLGGNNTYWPRDMRQLAILVAFAAVVLLGSATRRAIAVGAIGSGIWIAADLVLDRFDVGGNAAFAVLAAAGALWFALTAFVATRAGHAAAPPVYRTVAATATVVLASAAMLVTTPWDEPVSAPDQVRVENALSMLQIGLTITAFVVAIGIAGFRRRSPVFVGVAAVGTALAALYPNEGLGILGVLVLTVGGVLTVSAADAWEKLLMLASATVVAIVPVGVSFVLISSVVGTAMTSIAGNPAINSADMDVSTALAALVTGVLSGLLVYAFERPAPAQPADSAAHVAYN